MAAAKKTGTRTRRTTTKKDEETKNTTPPNAEGDVQQVTSMNAADFRKWLTEKYNLASHQWWEVTDKQAKPPRTVFILHHSGLKAIANQEGLCFSRPIIHEQPGRVITYQPCAGSDQTLIPQLQIHSVMDLPLHPQGRTANHDRWSLEGWAWKKLPDGSVDPDSIVHAVASASGGGKGDGVGYGSGFLGAHNRLEARLIREMIGATGFPIYGDEEDPEFRRGNSDSAREAREGAKEEVSEPPAKAAADNLSTNARSSEEANTPPSFEAPKMESKALKPEAKEQIVETPESKPEPVEETVDLPEAEPEPAKDDSDEANPTETRMGKYLAMSEADRFKSLCEEVERATHVVHLTRLWRHCEPIAETLPEDLQRELIEHRDNFRAKLARAGSFEEVDEAELRSPQAVADDICKQIIACKTMKELADVWTENLPVYRNLSAALRKQVKASKDARKNAIEAAA